jgi:hypothetical protein
MEIGQRFGRFELRQPEHVAIKTARRHIAVGWPRHTDMLQTYIHGRILLA